MSLFAGLDWGSTGHVVCVLDERGAVVARLLEVRHDAAGLADLLARLKRLAAPADLPVAIERPSGLVVETLIAAGHPVVPIHPNVVKACRPRYRAAGAKSDPGDAYKPQEVDAGCLIRSRRYRSRLQPGRCARARVRPVARSDRRLMMSRTTGEEHVQ